MLIKDLYTTREDGVTLYKTYSNANKIIKQVETNIEYEEAIDISDSEGNIPYTYVETDIDIVNE